LSKATQKPGVKAPGYTQVPNVLLDEWALTLGEGPLRMVLALARQTFGWHRGSCRLSLTGLQEITRMSRSTVINAIKTLEQEGILQRQKDGDRYLYSLVVQSDPAEPPTGSPERPAVVAESYRPLTKERKNGKERRVGAGTPTTLVTMTPLSDLLIELATANGARRLPDPNPAPKAWADAERLLITKDGRDPAEAERLLRWCQADDFWRSNILSMPKFRERYDQLLLQAKRSSPARRRAAKTSSRVQELLARSQGASR
jgi:phage replication O-like protein O